MLRQWRVVRSRPGQYSDPAALAELWDGGLSLDVPAPVATIAPAADLDDFDWWQRCIVEFEEPTCVEFKGLTFPATIFVDGARVAECASMFLPVRVELSAGSHEICVCFGSLNAWLRTRRPRGRWRSSLVSAAGLRWARTTLLGRAPVYGNLPAPVGFWRPVIATPTALRADSRLVADAKSGVVELTASVPMRDELRAEAVLYDPAGEVATVGSCSIADGGKVRFELRVDDPQLWWPHGYGPQSLYRATIKVDDQVIADHTFGFRSVEAVTNDGGFGLRINGESVFCRGVTWAPVDPVRLSVDSDSMRAHLEAFASAGANMVRVIGGLVYEQPEFWEQCARLGVMVWQDAMQATFDPPAEVADLVVLEISELLSSVSGNPALVIVSGGSETLQRPEMLGLERGEFAMPLIDSLLPAVVAEQSDVPYVRASPSPPPDEDDLAIRPDTGIAHWFGVGGYLRPISDVRSAGVRFAAECLAFSNPPAPAAVERHFGSAAVAGHHPDWKAEIPRDRGSSWDFEDVRDFYVRDVFGVDPLAVRRVDPERYLELGRLAAAEAMHQCFAFWRQRDSNCSGALVLSGKDLRPGAGWGLMDVDGGTKAALNVLRTVWAPVAVVLTNAGLSGLRIDVYNDTMDTLTGELSLIATNYLGQRTVDAGRDISLAPRSALTFYDSDLSGGFRDLSHSFRFGQPTADGVEAVVRFAGEREPVRTALIVQPRPGQANAGIRALATPVDETDWVLEVSADVALRYVAIDSPGWEPSDNYFQLPAATPYCIRLTRRGDRDVPSGKVTSVDSLVAASITTGS
jgi:beta-mannosidase